MSPSGHAHPITRLLRLAQSDEAAADELQPLIYAELHDLARALMHAERGDHTLQATALVHEAWLRLAQSEDPPDPEDRRYFLGAAARAMRRILVEHARKVQADKRGGQRPQSLEPGDDVDAPGEAVDTLALHEALERLGERDPELVQIVELRYFAGLTLAETGDALGQTVRQVHRAWGLARGWLQRELGR